MDTGEEEVNSDKVSGRLHNIMMNNQTEAWICGLTYDLFFDGPAVIAPPPTRHILAVSSQLYRAQPLTSTHSCPE